MSDVIQVKLWAPGPNAQAELAQHGVAATLSSLYITTGDNPWCEGTYPLVATGELTLTSVTEGHREAAIAGLEAQLVELTARTEKARMEIQGKIQNLLAIGYEGDGHAS